MLDKLPDLVWQGNCEGLGFFYIEINDKHDIKYKNLRDNKPADDENTKRLPCFRPNSPTENNKYSSHNNNHDRHHDWTEANQNSFINDLDKHLDFIPLPFKSKIDHHDHVLFYDADKHDEPNEHIDTQIHLKIIKNDQCS